MSEVVFDAVTKHYDDVVAVEGLSLEIVDEEFMVLLGPSGCGKTTALRMVAGLEAITAGTLQIGGRTVNDVEAKDRNVSMVFQSYALYPHMTVTKNIESPLVARTFHLEGEDSPRKLSRAERSARVHEAADTLGLGELLSRKPAALSGGQRQRVALARAIVSRPRAFLMDEPLSNLDAKLRAQTRLELVGLHRRLATTFLYVTHDQVEAMTMATRIAVMNEGRLQQVGAPQAVYERPQNLFVARFIGSPPMNTVPGRVALDAGELFVDLGAGRLRVSSDGGPATRAHLGEGSPVIVGVRPEHLRIEGTGAIQAKVSGVEWLGHERHVVCDIGDSQAIVRQNLDGPAPGVGMAVRLGAVPGEIHLFDPVTTERLN